MAQFFIIRKFKGNNRGQLVAYHCFDKFKGIWEVMVMPDNKGTYLFWKSVINRFTYDYLEYKRHVKRLINSEKYIFL
jgi:predicted acetyltransferase